MDPFTSLALTATIAAVVMYVLYWVIRKGVAAGIRDAREASAEENGRVDGAPEGP